MSAGTPPTGLLRSLESFVRRRWRRLNLRGVERADAHVRLELLYRLHDPWNMESDRERFRFEETSRILRRALVDPAERVESILEIGCGEGHQSAHLAPLCRSLTGIDISATAVRRARERLPGALFESGDLLAKPWAAETDRFDVVTAFEVLYYVKDMAGFLATMSRLGRTCIVSYYEPSAPVVEPFLAAMPVEGRERFRFEDVEWRVAWWRNARS